MKASPHAETRPLPQVSLVDLPGAELVCQGLEDLARDDETQETLLLAIGAPRLRDLGLEFTLPETFSASRTSPEIALYELLGQVHGNEAHSRYNALIRRLVSFERAFEQRLRHGEMTSELAPANVESQIACKECPK